ncbi:tetratricopeptide repeat protein 33-like [Artemia franciscana]|uniref:tetratricopeptide repeat protein 33-like n=1 Tax=Artemia franciscana TaxID=6661 RepID=UPI0032DA34BE
MWKRKAGDKIKKTVLKPFTDDEAVEEETVFSGLLEENILLPQPKKIKFPTLEDSHSKARRLKLEGATLAEGERYWEAIKRFDGALQFTPLDETIHEMKAQAYMQLQEIWPAVSSAEEAVRLNQLWYIGHQTLGRARLGVGDVQLALKSFMKAYHLNPTSMELYVDDLLWAKSLNDQRKEAHVRNIKAEEKKSASPETSVVIADYFSEEEVEVTFDTSRTNIKSVTELGESEVKENECVAFNICSSTSHMVKMNLNEARK